MVYTGSTGPAGGMSHVHAGCYTYVRIRGCMCGGFVARCGICHDIVYMCTMPHLTPATHMQVYIMYTHIVN